MEGTTLKYYTKQASPDLMEASFNSDYSNLLTVAEEYVFSKTEEAYKVMVLMLLNDSGLGTDVALNKIIEDLFSDMYRYIDALFRPWYHSAFGHLSTITPEVAFSLYEGTLTALSVQRAVTMSPRIIESLRGAVNKPGVSSVSDVSREISVASNRMTRTETNGAAGQIVEATAVSLFSEAGLYKRWISVGDERVRFTHRHAASRRPIPQKQLFQVGDVFMRFPADPMAFGGNVAGEIINCRCRSLIMPYSAVRHNANALNGFLVGRGSL